MEILRLQLQTVVEERHFQSDVRGVCLLPLQVRIGKVGGCRGHLVVEGVHVTLADDQLRRLVVEHVTLLAVAGLHGQRVQPFVVKVQDVDEIGIA